MTLEIPKRAEPIVKAVEDLGAKIDTRIQMLECAKALYFEHVAERNSILVAISNAESKNEAKNALFDWTHFDDQHLTQVGATIQLLKDISEKAERIGGAAIGNIHVLESSLDEMERIVSGMKSRLRQHSQNSPEVRRQVLAVTGGRCFYCNVTVADVNPDGSAAAFHVDHIVAKAHGGPDHFHNYVPSCSACNSEKSDKPFSVFMQAKIEALRSELEAAREKAQPVLTVIEGGAA